MSMARRPVSSSLLALLLGPALLAQAPKAALPSEMPAAFQEATGDWDYTRRVESSSA